jgi:aromatic O-demethylase, cytochrome P450 subunit
VGEGLRWLAPFGMTEKLTTAEVTLGGILFPAGTEVAMVLGSANRDATRYADPDVFDLDRPRHSHASFGYGLHFCPGHFVARQLEQVMLEEMFARLPEPETRSGSGSYRARLGRAGRQAATGRMGRLTGRGFAG